MAETARPISVDKNSELGKLLDEARQTGEPLDLEVNGQLYRLMPQHPAADDPDGDPWKAYDPEKVRAALKKTAGSWADLDADTLIADIRKARDEGSRPAKSTLTYPG